MLTGELEMLLRNLLKCPQTSNRLAVLFTSVCVFGGVTTFGVAPTFAQSTQATVQEIIDGNQVFIQNKQAALNDIAKQRQQVRTGQSRTSLLFNTGAVARLSANSVLNIGQCARLKRGTILINGAVNACSASITTGVRGTTYLLEVDESGNQQVKVLEGEVVVKRNAIPVADDDLEDSELIDGSMTKPVTPATPNKNPKVKDDNPSPSNFPTTFPRNPQIILPPNDPQNARPLEPLNIKPLENKPVLQVGQEAASSQSSEVVLRAGEKVEVDQKGVLGVIQELTENEFVGLLTGNLFQGFTSQIPGIEKVRDVFGGLFPRANFPISLPNIPLPNIPNLPTPNLPRFPF
ncbi:MAG: hypothetical protein AUK48_05710 [Oscillatoriales cyanobacterium CG2_30_44_21]|nr:MAG: hypothetical protein AUK48_05710 [Oscillatoriales cyanobacterium CG2_30_44_21]